MTYKRDIYGCICNFNTFIDKCDIELHLPGPKLLFARLISLRCYLSIQHIRRRRKNLPFQVPS